MATRRQMIERLKRVSAELTQLKADLKGSWGKDDAKGLQQLARDLGLQEMTLVSQLQCKFPMTMCGYVGEDEEDVEQNEHGTVWKITHWLGCPKLDSKTPRPKDAIRYDPLADITQVLELNKGKYLKITIQALDIGERPKCEKCKERFVCLTTV